MYYTHVLILVILIILRFNSIETIRHSTYLLKSLIFREDLRFF